MPNTDNVMKVVYCWYHHNAVSPERQKWIEHTIESHDWEGFNVARDLYDAEDSPFKLSTKGDPMTYFPDNVFVYYGDDTHETVPLTKDMFNLITLFDHENG